MPNFILERKKSKNLRILYQNSFSCLIVKYFSKRRHSKKIKNKY